MKKGQKLLLKSAIQVAIIGSGNNSYGMIRDDDGGIIELKDIFHTYKIEYGNKQNEKYQKNTLSVRRLIRLLRYHIQKFIEKTKRPSYLWVKYSDKNVDMINICFPGAEHLITKEEEVKYLLNVYKNLDDQRNTNFVKRLMRVFIARGIIKPNFN